MPLKICLSVFRSLYMSLRLCISNSSCFYLSLPLFLSIALSLCLSAHLCLSGLIRLALDFIKPLIRSIRLSGPLIIRSSLIIWANRFSAKPTPKTRLPASLFTPETRSFPFFFHLNLSLPLSLSISGSLFHSAGFIPNNIIIRNTRVSNEPEYGLKEFRPISVVQIARVHFVTQ